MLNFPVKLHSLVLILIGVVQSYNLWSKYFLIFDFVLNGAKENALFLDEIKTESLKYLIFTLLNNDPQFL